MEEAGPESQGQTTAAGVQKQTGKEIKRAERNAKEFIIKSRIKSLVPNGLY